VLFRSWRFSWLMVVALSWWAAVGAEQLVRMHGTGMRRWVAPILPVILLLLPALPAGVPALPVPLDGRPGDVVLNAGPVLTLPAPATEFDEDQTEALWLTRSLTTGQPVTGGATGWVPPEIRLLRRRMLDCEEGRASAAELLREMRINGITWAEIALRPGDEQRIDFWRAALAKAGAVRHDPWPQSGYEMYRLSDG